MYFNIYKFCNKMIGSSDSPREEGSGNVKFSLSLHKNCINKTGSSATPTSRDMTSKSTSQVAVTSHR